MLVKMPDKTTCIPARKSGPRRFGISRKSQKSCFCPWHSLQGESPRFTTYLSATTCLEPVICKPRTYPSSPARSTSACAAAAASRMISSSPGTSRSCIRILPWQRTVLTAPPLQA